MEKRQCEWCKNDFELKVVNKRFCSIECFAAHRKEYCSRFKESRKTTRNCKQCGNPYSRVYEKNGFCTISFGSKWHASHGTFDSWKRSNIGKRSGQYVPCDACGKTIYIVEHQKEFRSHFCDRKCRGKYYSTLFSGVGNPMFGRKLSKESLIKQKRTLLQNHGVSNAYFLSKHRTTSKAQKEILTYLSSSMPEAQFESEKFFHSGSHRYFIDILSEPLKMIIEYNGDYWHCNPQKYSGSFFHPKKQKYAEQIWSEDRERMNTMKKRGYSFFTVWENEFASDKQSVFDHLVEAATSASKGGLSG